MALDRRKGLQNAERLLKQGKVQAALSELERVSESAPDDLLTLNRLGDLLARQGRAAEAVAYYRKIADQFAQGGFFPKAAAIHKKILRLDPQNTDSLVQLGHLYIEQRLHGEARSYLLHAANQHLQARQFDRAEVIYAKLAEAEPEDLRHRVRLAEARAAQGKSADAANELVTLGDSLLSTGDASEAEKLYSRAAQLAPTSEDAVLGLARCLSALERGKEAIGKLEAVAATPGATPRIAGELAATLWEAGRGSDAMRVLGSTQAFEIEPEAWRRLLQAAEERGERGRLWSKLDAAFRLPAAKADKHVRVLETLTDFEGEAGLEAAERLQDQAREQGDVALQKRALGVLAEGYRALGNEGEAARARQRLADLAPAVASAPAAKTRVEAAAKTTQAPAAKPAARPPADSAGAPRGSGQLPPEVEAPAVPLSRADQEFAAGRLTQAEVLEKYGLASQAQEQVEAVAQKFPGHVAAQRARVELLRAAGGQPFAEALASLAIAQRAAGETDAAVESALAASDTGALPAANQAQLVQAGLLAGAGAAAAPARSTTRTASEAKTSGAREVVFDLGEDEGTPEAAVSHASPSAPPAVPLARNATRDTTDDVIDELSEIAAALEEELFADGSPLVREDGPQESVDEIFAAFKQRVKEHVSNEDYRMHYDLGIGFKSMGLIDEAISAFEHAVASPDLRRESCTMIAVCHHERGENDQAVQWYRKAIEAGDGSADLITRLRYDLAEVLLEAGDARGALHEFRDVLQANPSYRDVQGRVHTLEASLGS